MTFASRMSIFGRDKIEISAPWEWDKEEREEADDIYCQNQNYPASEIFPAVYNTGQQARGWTAATKRERERERETSC